MKRFFIFLLSLLLACPLMSCDRSESQTRTVFALDTYCTFTCWGVEDSALSAAEARLLELEKQFSVTEAESLVSRINRGERPELTAEAAHLLLTAQRVTRESDGAFDVTVYPLVEAYGYYTDEYRVPSDAQLSTLLTLVGGDAYQNGSLSLSEGQKMDFGGIAKGYLADVCADLLRDEGASGVLLSFGGNVCARGNKPDGSLFRVAVMDPKDTSAYLGTVEMTDASLVTAGAYQRGFEENGVYYHHILDPKTGRPAQSGLLSATVLCKDGARADALATACFVLGEEGALSLWREVGDFELILVREDGSVLYTEGLEGKFTSEKRGTEFAKKNG